MKFINVSLGQMLKSALSGSIEIKNHNVSPETVEARESFKRAVLSPNPGFLVDVDREIDYLLKQLKHQKPSYAVAATQKGHMKTGLLCLSQDYVFHVKAPVVQDSGSFESLVMLKEDYRFEMLYPTGMMEPNISITSKEDFRSAHHFRIHGGNEHEFYRRATHTEREVRQRPAL